ncbi:thymidylate synthase [Chryseobacterium indologenes]|nr:thymidylate synthase [Chryseobacterium indologenes]QPQ53269.1 thymidylate synthase [Chryseobacterium indologenes]
MYIEKQSLDDIIHDLLNKIREQGINQKNSKGQNKEILGVYIKLTNPLNRISTSFAKSVFVSPIGEFLWYMSGSNNLDFIMYYIKKYVDFSNDGKILNGAYGARLFSKVDSVSTQIDTVVELLKRKENTRQAVIQIFDKNDLLDKDNLDIPCTCTLQFFIRDNKLILFVTMRSNDVFVGLPHDIFCFTMLQEIIAKELKKEIGSYNHFISSCHYYMADDKDVDLYLSEGLQTSKTQMEPMPNDTSLLTMKTVLEYENKIRNLQEFDIEESGLNPYWKDLLYILLIFSLRKTNKKKAFQDKVKNLLHLISNENYKIYIKEKFNV